MRIATYRRQLWVQVASLLLLVQSLPYPVAAEEPASEPKASAEVELRDWRPRSMMVTKTTEVATPKFPAIDVHNHLGAGKQHLTPERVASYLREMNEAGVRTVVNLDGYWGERLSETLDALDRAHPDRFLTFAQIDFSDIDNPDWTDRERTRLDESFRQGAKGLKIHKSLGLTVRYKDGRLLPIDDPKLDPLWALCGERDRPIMIHSADPAAFFTPLDRNNERWHELADHPGWMFNGPQFPAREDLLAQFLHVVEKHPKTTFIGAHFGNNAENLAFVASALDKYPNLYVDIDARISELGRQPYSARRFFLKYQDRILFGTDTPPQREAFRIYYRFLETDDEYFDCEASHHLQGLWQIYGIFLPDEVLEKIYRSNAEKVLFGLTSATTATKSAVPQTATNAAATALPRLRVPHVADFDVTGHGSHTAWERAAWEPLHVRETDGADYESRFKLLYSDNGLYVLFDGADRKLSVTDGEDFRDLWKEDCFEIFLWPDDQQPLYFEYEISPLGAELPLLIPNLDGTFLGWRPWHYEGPRKVQKMTATVGGDKAAGAEITRWRAEFFIPFDLLKPLTNVPPKPGSTWRANLYRMDYDSGRTTSWDWSRVGNSFHEFAKFGTLEFE